MKRKVRKARKAKKKSGVGRAFSLILLLLLVIGFSAAAFSGSLLYNKIDDAKASAAQAADSLRSGDYAGAESALADLNAIIEEYYILLTESPLTAAKWIPGVGGDVNTVVQYMELWREAYPKLVIPVLDKAQETGLPSMGQLSADPGAFAQQLREYAGLFETLYPELLAAAERVNEIPDFHVAAIADRVGPYQMLLKELCKLLPALKDLPDGVIRPAADLLESYPLSSLKAQDGVNIVPVVHYLDFYDQVRPYTIQLTDALERVDLSSIGKDKNAKFMDAVESVKHLLERVDTYTPVVQMILAGGKDQNFMIVAQNSAELRAGGGFPGVVCIATVKDGCASLGEFTTSWDLLRASYVVIAPDKNEKTLFGSFFIDGLKDATFNPHFPWVASTWASAHGYRFHTTDHGVVTLTLHVVQKLIEICGPITLSNGVEVTSENFMQYLQHDIYYQYLAKDTADLKTVRSGMASDDVVDALFEETAKKVIEKTLDKVENDLTLHDIEMLLNLVEDSFANRALMIWMEDEEIQQRIKELGWSGSLNWNPEKPEIGVYYSVMDANKVGYFVRIETTCDDSGAVRNEDGSMTWPVKVRLYNTLTEEDLAIGEGNWYKLLGSYNGDIASIVHLFAPAGGRIDNLEYSILVEGLEGYEAEFPGFTEGEYQELQVFYNTSFWLHPGEVIEFTYSVTTAPGVSVKPTFSRTPDCSLSY